jgi:hypothetical protein
VLRVHVPAAKPTTALSMLPLLKGRKIPIYLMSTPPSAQQQGTSSLITFPQRNEVLLPNAKSPSSTKMRRRFYHLGVERTDLPPRDIASLTDPECVAYIPQVPPGLNANLELQRNLQYNATGSPPPKPKYFSDVDRCHHFALPSSGGGMDVGPHFIYRPAYQLAMGDYPHTDLFKEFLTLNMSELEEMRRGTSTATIDLASRSGVSIYSTPSRRRVSTSMAGANVEWSPSNRPRESSASPLPHQDIEAQSPETSRAEDHQLGIIAGSPTRVTIQALRSFDVARQSSSLEATKQTRRRNILLKREKQLKVLTKMGHPNQVTVYLPQ